MTITAFVTALAWVLFATQVVYILTTSPQEIREDKHAWIHELLFISSLTWLLAYYVIA